MTTATPLPFSKHKPGMRVALDGGHTGTILSKHKGTETLIVAIDGDPDHHLTVTVENITVLPADPLDQVHPMLAKNIEDYKKLAVTDLIADPEWVAEKKYDGERSILMYTPAHCGTASVFGSPDHTLYQCGGTGTYFRATTRVVGKNTGRLGVTTYHLPHLAALPVPRGGVTIFDGELLHTKYDDDEQNFRLLRSIMGSLPERAREMQQVHGNVRVRLYDVLWFNGEDLRGKSWEERRTVLRDYLAHLDEYLATDDMAGDPREASAHFSLSPVAGTATEKQALYDRAMDEGWEGLMFKRRAAPYTDTTKFGARSADLLKFKPFQDTEVIILGFEQGEGEYNQDRYGAIRFAQFVPNAHASPEMLKSVVSLDDAHENIRKLVAIDTSLEHLLDHVFVEMGTASGFTAEQEAMFRVAPQGFIGRVMTVKYQSRWKETGRMRHAHFKAMRDEVDPYTIVYAGE